MRILLLPFVYFTVFSFCYSQQGSCPPPIPPPPPTSLKTSALSYINQTRGNYRFIYKMTLECSNNTPVKYPLFITDMNTGAQRVLDWILDSVKNITNVLDPCIVLNSAPCLRTYYYHADAQISVYNMGAVAATINCCRPFNAKNLFFEMPYNYVETPCCGWCQQFIGPISNGMVNFIKLPIMPPLQFNSSPQFVSNDTILFVCNNRTFSYQIKATDPDGDSIAYHISPGRTFEMNEINSQAPTVSNRFPFPVINYKSGFSAEQPVGNNFSLNAVSGEINGMISDTGTFIVPVSAVEYRNGVLFDSITQDVILRVYDCTSLPKPKASIPDSINSCSDLQVFFTNNSTPLYPHLNWNNTSFLWNFGDGDTSSLVKPTHAYADTGTFNVRLIIFPDFYCADTAYAKAIVYPIVKANFNYNDSCSTHKILFTNTSFSTSGAISYSKWTFEKDSSVLHSTNEYSPEYAFIKAPQTYTVILEVGNNKGCAAKDTQYINIYKSPSLLPTHDTIISLGSTLQLHADDGNSNYNGQFLWSPSKGLSNPDISNPIVNSVEDGTYYVQIKNAFGCSVEDSIHIAYYKGPDIYVPNAFTPNGDGKNDVFKPVTVGISVFKYFRIYNRYGQLVFQTNKPKEGWSGNINGNAASEGTYVWETEGIDLTGKLILRKGTVILIR